MPQDIQDLDEEMPEATDVPRPGLASLFYSFLRAIPWFPRSFILAVLRRDETMLANGRSGVNRYGVTYILPSRRDHGLGNFGLSSLRHAAGGRSLSSHWATFSPWA